MNSSPTNGRKVEGRDPRKPEDARDARSSEDCTHCPSARDIDQE